MTVRRWVRVCSLRDLEPGRGVAALIEGQRVAVFLLPGTGGGRAEAASRLRAIDDYDPVSGANVLSRGLLGSTGGVYYVASPMHKHRFDLASGRCLDGVSPGVRVWPVRVWGSTVELLSVLPGPADHTGGGQPTRTGIRTHCPFCALQCAMRLRAVVDVEGGDASRVEIESDPSFPVNQGRMCLKGWASVGLLRNPSRLAEPMVRNPSGQLERASWDAALDEVARRILAIQAQHGRDALGVFGSGALTNEKAYLLGKFARVALRTANIDYNGRYCMSSAAAAQNRAFGIDRGLPFPLADIAEAGTLVLWGANPADTMPPLMPTIERMRAGGGTLVVVDPRRTTTAQVADLYIQPVPGTDIALALGLLHLAIATSAVDETYLRARTQGWDEVRASVGKWCPEKVEAITGIAESQARTLLDSLVGPSSSMLISGRGPEQQSKGVDTVTALINLMLAIGRVGRPGSGYGCLTGQANGQGGREHGQKADQLPGYRSITNPDDRATIAEVWGIDPGELPGAGMSAVEMLDSIGSRQGIRGLLVFGSDIAAASPNGRRACAQLERLDLLVVADALPTGTTDIAHVVLPVTQWAEEDGTTTNLEGRVIRRRRSVEPPPGVRTDLDILAGLAERLGSREQFRFETSEDVFDELRLASAGGRADYSGITYRRLDAEPGVFWPCPSEDHPGTPRVFTESFGHPNGRARLIAVSYRPVAEEPDAEYPVYLTTGRYREHYNSGSQTRRLDRLTRARSGPQLQLHPILAVQLGVIHGSSVMVESRRGSAVFEADITADIRQDTVFAPFHWGGDQSANQLTIATLDPISRMPEFKVCAVRLRPA